MIYVWVDALTNYLTGVGFPSGKEMLERWNGPSQRLATALRSALMQRDVYMICRWNLLIAAPPLVINEDELRIGVRAIDEALAIADRYAATGEL